MAKAIWFLIIVSIKLLSISVIVCKSEMDTKILMDLIFLGYPQGFGLLVNALHFKLDSIRWSIKNLAPCFDLLIYGLLIINNYLVFGVQVQKCLIVSGL